MEWLVRRAKWLIFTVFLIALILGNGIRYLSVDSDQERLLGMNQSTTIAAALPPVEIDERVAVIVAHDNQLFTLKKLQQLQQFQQQLTQLSDVKSVHSLFNTPNLAGYMREHQWFSVLEPKRIQASNMTTLKKDALANQALIHQLINPDATTLAFVIQLKKTTSNEMLPNAHEQIQAVIQRYHNDFQDLFQIGGLDENYYTRSMVSHDIWITGSLALLGLIVSFGLFFRNVWLGLMPFITGGAAAIWTLGIMGYLHIALDVLTPLAIIMSYTVGSVENAHFIHAYQKSQRDFSERSKAQHAYAALQAVFTPILITTLATVLGFLFNIFTSVVILKNFAIVICFAVALNTLFICVLTPAILSLKKPVALNDAEFFKIKKIVNHIYNKMLLHSKLVVVTLIVTLSLSGWAVMSIPLEVLHYGDFYEKSEFIQKILRFNTLISGTERLEINFSVKGDEDFSSRDDLRVLFAIEQEIAKLPQTSSTLSPATLVASTYQLFSKDNNYNIPDMRVIAYGIVSGLKESSDVMTPFLSKDDHVARIMVIYHAYTTPEVVRYVDHVKRILKKNIAGTNIHYEIGNASLAFFSSLLNLLKLQLIAISTIYLSVFVIMLVVFRSIKAGLLSIISDVFPLVGIIFTLYFFKIPFNIVSILVLSATIGLAVDDTVHILCSFKKRFLQTRNRDIAIQQTLESQLRPVTITTVTMMIGMSMLCFSFTKASMQYGALMVIGSAVAWISDFVLMPFLLKKIDITKRI